MGHFSQHGCRFRIHIEQRIEAGSLKLRERLSKPIEKLLRRLGLSSRTCQSLNLNPGLPHGFLKSVDPHFANRTILWQLNMTLGL